METVKCVNDSCDWLDKIIDESKDAIIEEHDFEKEMELINKYLEMNPMTCGSEATSRITTDTYACKQAPASRPPDKVKK